MIERSPSAVPPPRAGFHWPSFLMIVLTSISLLAFIGGSAIMLVSGILAFFDPLGAPYTSATLFSYALSGLLISLLLLPALVFNIQRFSDKTSITSRLLSGRLSQIPAWILVVAFLVTVGVGTLLLQVEAISWLVMPLLNVLALGLPVLIVIRLGAKNLGGGSLRRKWSVFTAGMVFSPALIFTIEIFGFLIGLVAIAALASTRYPQIQYFLMEMAGILENAAADPDQLNTLLAEMLSNPYVLTAMIAFLSVFVPVVEELLKPAAIWLLARRRLTPNDGWVLGLLSGAGFALVENLGNVSINEGWGFIALARFGATALHMFNTGIIGYTFVLAREQKRYRRLILVIFGTFIIHGIWNALAIFANVHSLESGTAWSPIFVGLLALISAGLIYALIAVNKRLQPAPAPLHAEEQTESES